MSIAENMMKRKSGETSANSTRAWLRWRLFARATAQADFVGDGRVSTRLNSFLYVGVTELTVRGWAYCVVRGALCGFSFCVSDAE